MYQPQYAGSLSCQKLCLISHKRMVFFGPDNHVVDHLIALVKSTFCATAKGFSSAVITICLMNNLKRAFGLGRIPSERAASTYVDLVSVRNFVSDLS